VNADQVQIAQDNAQRVAQECARAASQAIARGLGVHALQGYSLLIDASLQALFVVSKRGLADYLRAHAAIIESKPGKQQEKAIADLQCALRAMSLEAAQTVAAQGRRPS